MRKEDRAQRKKRERERERDERERWVGSPNE